MADMSSPTGQARPAAPMATADLEAAIAALPVRKQRLRETFDRLVACAPPHYHLPFTWADIDAHVSSLHASLSLRFRQMQQQPHPGAPVSATAIHDAEQPHPCVPVPVPVPATATPADGQPDPCVPVSATHGESIQEDEEMVTEDEDASHVQEDGRVEDAGMGFVGAPWRQAGGTRDQELPVPARAHALDAGSPMLRQPYSAFGAEVHSQLNLPMLQRQQPYMPYQQQEFPAMAVARNTYNIPPMVQQPYPYHNIPPRVQRPYVPYFRQEFSPDFRQEFFPDDDVTRQPFRQEFCPGFRQDFFPDDDVTRQPFRQEFSPGFRQEFFPDDDVTRQPFRQEFFPDVTRQPPMGIDHVLQEQYMAMAHHQPYSTQQQYMAHHQPHFPVAQAPSAHGQGSNTKRRPPSKTTDTDNINVRSSKPSKKSRRNSHKHHGKPKPNNEPFQKKTIYDYF
ncbi:unnamed protein product [Triticum turgidum subsp. durum]|uniref:Uncharacterized protein n=1 Tax=Triticum turgidum subsp. durum TaxID=4567 RepID=A0A9R0PQ14_TRITD|nr:unnamed protein product [Triticum turgidum subsp. durum]